MEELQQLIEQLAATRVNVVGASSDGETYDYWVRDTAPAMELLIQIVSHLAQQHQDTQP